MERDRCRPAFPHTSPAYERFLRMPAAVVVTVVWVLGMALLSSGVLTLYALGRLLASVVGA